MAYDLEEQEQLDALRDWWKQHARTVLAAVAVFALTITGLQGWRWYQKDQSFKASAIYEAVLDASQKNDAKRVREAAGMLIDQHARSDYAVQAALVAARVNLESGDAVSARAQLQWAVEHGDADARDLARLRLAGLDLDEGKPAEALKRLAEKHGEAYVALYQDLRGDALLAQGSRDEAVAAYRAALDKAEAGGTYRRLIQLKLDALGGGERA